MPRPARETGTAALVATPPPRAPTRCWLPLRPTPVQRVLRNRDGPTACAAVSFHASFGSVFRIQGATPVGHLGAVRAVVFPELVLARAETDGPRRVAGAAHHRVPVPHARVLSRTVWSSPYDDMPSDKARASFALAKWCIGGHWP